VAQLGILLDLFLESFPLGDIHEVDQQGRVTLSDNMGEEESGQPNVAAFGDEPAVPDLGKVGLPAAGRYELEEIRTVIFMDKAQEIFSVEVGRGIAGERG